MIGWIKVMKNIKKIVNHYIYHANVTLIVSCLGVVQLRVLAPWFAWGGSIKVGAGRSSYFDRGFLIYTYIISFRNESNSCFLQILKNWKIRSSYLCWDLNRGPPAPKANAMTTRQWRPLICKTIFFKTAIAKKLSNYFD